MRQADVGGQEGRDFVSQSQGHQHLGCGRHSVTAEEPEAVWESYPRDVAWSSGERAGMSLRHQSEGGQSPLGVIWRKKGSGDRALEPPNVKRRGVCVCVEEEESTKEPEEWAVQ